MLSFIAYLLYYAFAYMLRKYFLVPLHIRWKILLNHARIIGAYMEFLDPEDKRARTTRLFVGYALIAILIGLATLILVYLAQGYGYNPSKGVSQNGLVFFGSKPGSADIYIDGQKKESTDARLTLTEGVHQVTLKKDKYRDWSKSINVDGGSVQYVQYPRLFPVNIPLGITQAYDTPPVWASQSLDRHWLLLQAKSNAPIITVIDLLKPTTEPLQLTLPSTVLITDKDGYGTLSPIEWSDDNRHLLLKQTLASGKIAYIMLDSTDIAKSLNITNQIKLSNVVNVVLRDKAYDKYYVHDAPSGQLYSADLKAGIQSTPLLSGVVAFKPYADNLIMYVTYNGAVESKANVYILSNQTDSYLLQPITRDANNRYMLDIAKYEDSWYYVTASASGDRAIMYRDPLSKAKPSNTVPISPRLALVTASPQFVSFSDNARFIAVQSGKRFVVFDAELARVYRYESALAIPDSQQSEWMDGHRIVAIAENKAHVFDFDGTNQQLLVATRPEYTAFFDRDYKYVFTLIPQADGRVGLQTGQITLD